jgi:DNA-binding NtrC family response regulator
MPTTVGTYTRGGQSESSAPTLLAVDDEEPIRSLLELHLGSWLSCVTVGSAEEAFEVLGQRAFDVVLSDVKLPKASGLEICDFVRRHDPDTVMMLMTGYGAEYASRAIEAGVFAFITKPFDLAQIDKTIENALRHRTLALAARLKRSPRA